jgi:hypothetical protein
LCAINLAGAARRLKGSSLMVPFAAFLIDDEGRLM